jgi:hypothetical protein
VTDLLTRPFLRRVEPAWGSRVAWLAGVLAAAWALVAGLAVAALPATLVWVDEGAGAPVGDPVRFGVQVWLAGHRVGLHVDGAEFRLAPLGLTVVIALLLYRAARWAAHAAGVSTAAGAVAVVLPAAVLYSGGAGALAVWATTGQVSAEPRTAAALAGAVAVLAVGAGVGYEAGFTDRLSGRRPVLRAAAVAVAGLFAVGSLLVAGSAVGNSGRIGAVAEALHPDLPGALALALLGAALVPNAAIWAAGYALGPGFALGAGTSVAPGAVELGIVPAVPALAALPTETHGWPGWLVLAGPVLVGVLTGVVTHRFCSGGVWRTVAETAAAAAVAGVAMAGLALLSGGSAGAARMSVIGPLPWETALATFLEVGVPAGLVVAVLGRRSG